MSRQLTRLSLLPATLLLAALAACAGDLPTAPRLPDPRRSQADSVRQKVSAPTDSTSKVAGGYENPLV